MSEHRPSRFQSDDQQTVTDYCIKRGLAISSYDVRTANPGFVVGISFILDFEFEGRKSYNSLRPHDAQLHRIAQEITRRNQPQGVKL